jgi:hypothetical protein
MPTDNNCRYFVYAYGSKNGRWEVLFTRQWVSSRLNGDATVNIVKGWMFETSGAAEYYVSGLNALYLYVWRDCGRGWEQI